MDYTGLKSAVVGYSKRTDLDASMDLFTELAEATINKDLRALEMEKLSFITLTDTYLDLPTDYLGIRAMMVDGAPHKYSIPLVSIEQLGGQDTGGNLAFFTVHGNQFEFRPGPTVEAPQDVELSYYARVPSLITESTNVILDDYPMIYLSAMLIQVYLYLQDDVEMGKWVQSFNSQVQAANKSAVGGRYLTAQVRVA